MSYIDGVVAPVLAGRKEEYRAFAERMASLFIEHGALEVVDGYGEADVPEGKQTDLWRAVAADKAGGEGVAFSWIVWPSKAVRDTAWGALEKDERMQPPIEMPFDGKRMIFGGFDVVNSSKAG